MNNRLKSEEQLFREPCTVGKYLMNYMLKEQVEVPSLRCVHTKSSRRRVVSVCSSRIRKHERNVGVKEVVTFCMTIKFKGREMC